MKRLFPSTSNHRPLTRLRRRHRGYAALGYVSLVIGGAFLGAEIVLRSKTRWVKGDFVPVGRRGNKLYLPASPETLSKGPLGIVPLLPNRGHLVVGPHRMGGRREEGGVGGGACGGAVEEETERTAAVAGVAEEGGGGEDTGGDWRLREDVVVGAGAVEASIVDAGDVVADELLLAR